jgi:hypothetical protein
MLYLPPYRIGRYIDKQRYATLAFAFAVIYSCSMDVYAAYIALLWEGGIKSYVVQY